MSVEVLNQNEYIMIVLKGECPGDEVPSVDKAFIEMMTQSGLKYAVVQCSECNTISTSFIRKLSQIYRALKAQNGQIRLVSANDTILTLIKNNGVDRILQNKLSLRGALVDFGLVKQKEFDVNFINPFLNATLKVLKVQCFLEAKALKPFLKKPTDPLLLGDISGIISVTSETFSGTMAISIAEPMFAQIASNMLGDKITGINEENVDLVGELANMILGQAKIELSLLGYRLQMALPSCVWGKDHKIKHFGGGVCVVIPFETDIGTIYSEIMTSNNLLNQANQDKKETKKEDDTKKSA